MRGLRGQEGATMHVDLNRRRGKPAQLQFVNIGYITFEAVDKGKIGPDTIPQSMTDLL